MSFVLSATGTYYLVKYLVADRSAAVVAAICFAYCPHVFAHTPPHSAVDDGWPAVQPSRASPARRSAQRKNGVCAWDRHGGAGALCGYYADLRGADRRLRRPRARYASFLVAFSPVLENSGPCGCSGCSLEVCCLFPPYAHSAVDRLRPLARCSAAVFGRLAGILASSAFAHAWILRLIGHWKEVLFPGFVALTFGTGWG